MYKPISTPSRRRARKFLILTSIAASIALLAIALSRAQSQGRLFYVDPAGNDSSSGTTANSPWRTVAKVNSITFHPGDTVEFRRGGVWRETLEPHNGGTPGRPVVFTAYGDGSSQPIINGSDVITGWVRTAGSVYRGHSDKPGNVYADGGPGWGLVHACCLPGSGCAPTGSCAIGQMKPGSWTWEAATKTLYLWLPDGSDPNSHMIEAATRPLGMNVVGNAGEKSNIIVDGITFERTAGGGIYFYSNDDGGVGFTGIVVRNCVVTQVGTGQVDDGSYFNGIHYSQHAELPTAPIYEHNRISYTGNHGNSINSQAADNAQILYNECSHFNHHGVDVKGSKGVLVRGNVVHDSGDTNGIYEEYSADSLIENNIVYNLVGTVAGRGSGVQLDADCPGARIINNSIYNVLIGFYLIEAATVQYNAVANAKLAVIDAKQGGDIAHNVWGLAPTFVINNQPYDIAAWKIAGHPDAIASDPMWTDPGRGDFTPSPGSPLISAHAGVTPPTPPEKQ